MTTELEADKATLDELMQNQKDGTCSNDDWKDIWKDTDTPPWHIEGINKGLLQHYGTMMEGQTNKTVLVPLCGKSADVHWLYQQGNDVIGIELSEQAVEFFFSAHSLPFTKDIQNTITVFKSNDGRIKIYICDILEFKREYLRGVEVGAVWDRASFVAIDPSNRTRYINVIANLMATGARIIFERVDYLSDDEYLGPPPFLFTDEELTKLCGNQFEIQYLSERQDEKTDRYLLKFFLFTKK